MDRRLLAALTALLVACGGGGGDDGGSMTDPDPEPATGTLEVAASTTGEHSSSGFGVEIDGTQEGTVEPNGRTTISGLETGSHQVGLQLPGSCESEAANPKTVSVSAESTANASFSVSCQESWVVYSKASDGQKTDIYIARPDGSESRQLTDADIHERGASLSMQRQEVVFDAGDVFLVNMDGTGRQNLTDTNDPSQNLSSARYPTWHPDGQRILFMCAFTDTREDGFRVRFLCEMDPDGSNVQRIININDLLNCSSFCDLRYPDYSPDGRKIAFTINDSGVPGLYVVNRDGTGIQKLMDGAANLSSWGPEGEWLYYTRSLGTSATARRVNPDGESEVIRQRAEIPVPSPNGNRVIVREATFQGDFLILSLPDGEEVQTTSLSGAGPSDWKAEQP